MARFMDGRTGRDQLNIALILLSLLVKLASIPAASFSQMFGIILYYAAWAIWGIVLFRSFSKNLYKRRDENTKLMSWFWKLKSRWQGARTRHADKDHKYFTCKSCKAICRVPVGKGTIVITCPKCGEKIQAKSGQCS